MCFNVNKLFTVLSATMPWQRTRTRSSSIYCLSYSNMSVAELLVTTATFCMASMKISSSRFVCAYHDEREYNVEGMTKLYTDVIPYP